MAYDERYPQGCFDERPCELRGQVARYDTEYERHASGKLFLFFQPLAAWRHAKVTAHRKKEDFAECMRNRVDVHFPEATLIRVVLDNLSTHTPAALYEAFEPAEALPILKKLEFHYTPKHGSWLNMVELELSVLVNQCLKRRSPTLDALAFQVAAWQSLRNTQHATVHWSFIVFDARTNLHRLYS